MKREKDLQEKMPYERSKYYTEYNEILGYYQALSCMENARGESVLDLACGDGTITNIFNQHYEHVVGVDASCTHLAKAKELLPNLEFPA